VQASGVLCCAVLQSVTATATAISLVTDKFALVAASKLVTNNSSFVMLNYSAIVQSTVLRVSQSTVLSSARIAVELAFNVMKYQT
jgi:hypothetical protein